jgi:AcrR family transcriptional regulator
LVEAAERLFLERDFGSVSMDELASAAGAARRTLYNTRYLAHLTAPI